MEDTLRASRRNLPPGESCNLSDGWVFLQEKKVLPRDINVRPYWAGDHTLCPSLQPHIHARTSWRWTEEVTGSLPPSSQGGHFVLTSTIHVAPLIGSLRMGSQTWRVGAQTVARDW